MKFYSWGVSLGFDEGGGRVFWCSDGDLFSIFNLIEIFGGVTQKTDFDLSSLSAFPWVGICEEKSQFLCRRRERPFDGDYSG